MLLGLIWNHPLRPGMILDFQELSGGFQEHFVNRISCRLARGGRNDLRITCLNSGSISGPSGTPATGGPKDKPQGMTLVTRVPRNENRDLI